MKKCLSPSETLIHAIHYIFIFFIHIFIHIHHGTHQVYNKTVTHPHKYIFTFIYSRQYLKLAACGVEYCNVPEERKTGSEGTK